MLSFIEFDGETVIKTKHFEISFFVVNHSIPQSYGVAFKTPNGNIVNTGDYKFDFTPVGPNADFGKMASLGNEGIDLLLADSTNSEIPGFTPSESLVKEEIQDIFAKAPGRIIIATFASNVYRVAHIVETAKKFAKKVIVFGRSMVKVVEIGQKIEIINNDKDLFIKANAISQVDDNKLVILSTGSQGEQMAALSRISRNEHLQIKIKPKDTVVFSSSPIPGNSFSIGKLVNRLTKLGAILKINKRDGIFHTSGHATQGEQKLMFALTRPKNFMPVHGEHRMQKAYAATAQNIGLKKDNIFICDNGEVVTLLNGKCARGQKIHAGVFYIDQNSYQISREIFQTRQNLGEHGMINIFIPLDLQKRRLVNSPKIISKGFLYMKNNIAFFRELQKIATYTANNEIRNSQFTIEKLKTNIQFKLTNLIYQKIKRKPAVIPVVLEC